MILLVGGWLAAILIGSLVLVYSRSRHRFRWAYWVSAMALAALVIVPAFRFTVAALERPPSDVVRLVGSEWTIIAVDGAPPARTSTIRFAHGAAELQVDCRVSLTYEVDSDGASIDFAVTAEESPCLEQSRAVVDPMLGVSSWRVESQDRIVLAGTHDLTLQRRRQMETQEPTGSGNGQNGLLVATVNDSGSATVL